jgi:hypothetical protein
MTQRPDGSKANLENLVKEDDLLIATGFSVRALDEGASYRPDAVPWLLTLKDDFGTTKPTRKSKCVLGAAMLLDSSILGSLHTGRQLNKPTPDCRRGRPE